MPFTVFPFVRQHLLEQFKAKFYGNLDDSSKWCIAHKDRFLPVSEEAYQAYVENLEASFRRDMCGLLCP